MAENTKQPGIIGQQYEDRKTHKMGVLTERNEKYKTLLMRDADGKEFNINYSTFRSNWRKYTGDEVVQTSAQIEEAKQDEVVQKEKKSQRAKSAKKAIDEASEKPRATAEDKRNALNALHTIIKDAFEGVIPDVRVIILPNKAVKVHYKNHLIMGAYVRLNENRYTFDCCTEVANQIETGDIDIEKLVNDEWRISTRYRFPFDSLDDMLNIFVSVLTGYVDDTYIKPEQEKLAKKKAKQKNEENEEE